MSENNKESCTLECGAIGVYCKCNAEASRKAALKAVILDAENNLKKYTEAEHQKIVEKIVQEKLRQQLDAQTWKRYPDEKPNDRQNVAFVVRSKREKHLDGGILGGFYSADSGTFSVPGSGYDAYYWRPMFEPPEND